MRSVRTMTADGTEIRNDVNEAAVGSCGGSGSVFSGGFVNSATYSQFSSCVARFAACNNIFYIKSGHVLRYTPIGTGGAHCYTSTATPTRPRDRISQAPRTSFRAAAGPGSGAAADLHPRTRQVREMVLVALMPIPAVLDRDLRTRPTDQPPFSGTLNLPPAMISWYQDRAFLLSAEVLFQDRDRLVLRLPSAS
jgi:hypothetical protein